MRSGPGLFKDLVLHQGQRDDYPQQSASNVAKINLGKILSNSFTSSCPILQTDLKYWLPEEAPLTL